MVKGENYERLVQEKEEISWKRGDGGAVKETSEKKR